MKLDIIIPCYNAEKTLLRAVQSCLKQNQLNTLWLIDDGSHDQTWDIIQTLASQYPCIQGQKMPQNGGAARARNWGALQSQADLIAFLDADDEYQDQALSAAFLSMQQFNYLGLIRLRIQAVNLPEKYTRHPNFASAWQNFAMSAAGNTVFRRTFFLACGGFPQHELFQQLGGEDGALGLATVGRSVIGTLFDERESAVLHHWRAGAHVNYLLDAHLFGQTTRHISSEQWLQAHAITQHIQHQLDQLKPILNAPQYGAMPLLVSRS